MIYVLEDDESIRKLVVYSLTSAGLSARGFGTVSEFWRAVREKPPALALLDIMLPDGDGLEVLRSLRAGSRTAKLPVMLLTARGSEFDKVEGFDSGADDYLPKPFGVMELTARVKSLLRRSGAEPGKKNEEYRVGALFVSVPRHLVKVDDEICALTLKEFDILVYMLENRGVVLGRDRIMSAVWGQDFAGESRTVDVHIRTLRSKLRGCGSMIETVRGVGYCFAGEKQ
jgi:two-component system alkaline phosphatase synthesis response regulator PhoP